MVYVSARLVRRLSEKLAAENQFLEADDVGVASGVAPLDAGAKLPSAHIPPGFEGPPGPEGPAGSAGPAGPAGPEGQMDGMGHPSGTYVVLNPGEYTNFGNPAGAGSMLLTPIYVPEALDITSLGVYVWSTASTPTVHIGLYTNVGSAFTRHTLFGSLDCSTTGSKEIAGVWTIPAGILWMGWVFTGANCTLTGTSSPRGLPGPTFAGLNVWTAAGNDYVVMAGPTGLSALPASFTQNVMTYATAPVRFAAKKA